LIPASPLTELPDTPPPEENIPEPTPKAKRKYKEKKQIIDAVTELKDGPGPRVNRGEDAEAGGPMKDLSNILTGQRFLPRSSVVTRLLEIREDPLAHFLPTKVTPNGTFFCVAPPGLAPELADMFLHPVHTAFLPKRRGHSPEKGANKKARLDGNEDEIEMARRAASAAPSVLGSDLLGRGSVGPGAELDFGDHTGIMDDFQMDLGGDVDMGARARSAAPTDRSRLSTPAPDGLPMEDGEETYADATCPIAMFDTRPSQSQETEHEADTANEGRGYSKNTIKALGIIRKELQPVANEERQDRMISFRKISDKVRLPVG
jgi:cohesin complex subunit SCC1